jgi:hypothetical protein
MEFLTDCEILEYCQSSPDERGAIFQRAVDNEAKPVYQVQLFELCHALHILVKYHGVSPSDFRNCWADLCKRHIESGECFIHVGNDDADHLRKKIIGLPLSLPEDLLAQCADDEHYWGHNRHLVHRIKTTYSIDPITDWWSATPPEEYANQPAIKVNDQDIVLDTNNLIELVNQLPGDGFMAGININLPDRLSENAQRKFLQIIRTRGTAGKFIVPISTLEEAHWVIHKPDNLEKYNTVHKVFNSMLIDRENPLWNMFSIESINQEVFDYFLFIHESMEATGVNFSDFDDFGDLLVLAHGLYNGCKIATNEWFEGDHDVWDMVRPFFPFLVLEN